MQLKIRHNIEGAVTPYKKLCGFSWVNLALGSKKSNSGHAESTILKTFISKSLNFSNPLSDLAQEHWRERGRLLKSYLNSLELFIILKLASRKIKASSDS
ncbi:testis-expressed sequence 30 protein [Platysternon megacephalum]|uniref:Testis-expressed sequence 30 protein n=1 Tax=Platysternon megacephalum TaxID=55544 RepID=A0A4D9F4Q6_9SAUR|nr:testis-expressed sequence 30 protein [Platysternon megacephalum]